VYVVIHRITIDPAEQAGLLAEMDSVHSGLRAKPGFRWVLALRAIDDPSHMAAVAMWLNRADAGGSDVAVSHYDVATARGSMTPAGAAALVEWRAGSEQAQAFVQRWNAAYHNIEDRIGSRLLLDLDDPGRYTGLHTAADIDNLDVKTLAAPIAGEGFSLSPSQVERFHVVSLVEG
jgi:hypothetical protein